MTLSKMNENLSRLAVVGSYPVVIVLGFAFYMTLAGSGWHLTIASYSAALVGVGLIALHEIMVPYRRDWRPRAEDVRTDAIFIIVVQAALPYLLAITVVIGLAGAIQAGGLTVDIFWPHNIPIVVQVAMMLLAADFMRYWTPSMSGGFTPSRNRSSTPWIRCHSRSWEFPKRFSPRISSSMP